ncbi:MAG: hypothetical protein ACKN9E_11440 [Microcystaceae cyanobacterium]
MTLTVIVRDRALTHCQNALTLSQELGIPLAKDCEELLAKIQENLEDNG